MTQINRRRFVGLLGASGIVGAAGCLGDDDENPETDSSADAGGNDEDQPTEVAEFDFPAGADDSGIVSDRILSGTRDVLAATNRYRISREYELDYEKADRDVVETTYDVEGNRVHEHQLRDGTAIDRVMTPEQALCRAAEVDGDRSGQWTTDTVDPDAIGARNFHLYPFEKTMISALLDRGSFEFDGIVTVDEQRYARYSGAVTRREWVSHHRWDSARVAHELESPLEGTLSLLLSRDGAIRTVEYDLAGEVARVTHEGREVTGVDVRGTTQLEGDDLAELSTPDWAGSDGFREFAVEDWNDSRVYELTAGPALPGSSQLVYAEFYVMAEIDGKRYFDRFSKSTDFEVGDRLFVGFDRDEFVLSRFSISGPNALEEADQIEIGVYLFDPNRHLDRSLVYHEAFRPEAVR